MSADDVKAIHIEALRGFLHWRPGTLPDAGPRGPVYPGLGTFDPTPRASLRSDAIFISGRFRCGSTLLWNIFRNIDNCTAYYEPLNERRWFDPRARGGHTDDSHRNVSDYWREYEGLEALGEHYREGWVRKDLFMDEGFYDYNLYKFISILIEKSAGRPVLQFNRVDFRLPWLRARFPGASVVHLYRHPRDEWCSTLRDDLAEVARRRDDPGPLGYGQFYLGDWARDLAHHFPFLLEGPAIHPYKVHYFIWKLSYLFGEKYSMHSLRYEDLIADPRPRLEGMFRALGIEQYDLDRIEALVSPPESGRWRQIADDDWFRRHEETCEAVLADYLTSVAIPSSTP